MKSLFLIVALAVSFSAYAADTTVVPTGATPGSVWDSYGTAPAEQNNWINTFHLDQGVVVGHVANVWEVTPYAAINLTNDSKGYSWDNKDEEEAGVKLVRHFNSGQIDLGMAYGNEHRNGVDDGSKSGLMAYVDGWFGYESFNRTNTPGNIWFQVGNTSPFESGNILALGRIEQGYNFSQNDGNTFGVVGWGQAGFDTKGYSWNNRYNVGGGLRLASAGKHGSAALTVGVECYGGQSLSGGCGPAINLDLWDGWNKIGRSE